jgi:hypothetical protein
VARHGIPLYLAVHLICAWWGADTPVDAAEFYAVVERSGAVALCLSKGSILFADRCTGDGRLTIVEPIKEGAVVWRSAAGTVSLENGTQNPQCALSRAKWDPKAEKVVSTGRKITKTDRAALLKRLSGSKLPEVAELVEDDDITAFTLDLDGDGKEETVFAASNFTRLNGLWLGDKETRRYVILGGILQEGATYPTLFYRESGDYSGGTDATGPITLKGIVSISPGTGEIALLIRGGGAFEGNQTLIRYRNSTVQKIDTIEYTCN